MPATGTTRGRTLVEQFTLTAAEHGDVEAVVDPDGRVTFAGWWERAGRLASVLAGAGVGPGDVVAVALAPSVDFAVAYAAVVRVGAVVSGVDPRLGPSEVAGVSERSRPALVVCEGPMRARWPADLGVPFLDRAAVAAPPADVAHPPAVVSPHDPAAIVWTSGTTGRAKGAWFTHAALLAAADQAGPMTRRFDRRLMPLPFAHAGYMAKVGDQLVHAVTFVVPSLPAGAAVLLAATAAERIDVIGGVPTQYEQILAHPGLDDADLGSLRAAVVATAPASARLVAGIRTRLGVPAIVRYAATECPSITGTDPDDDPTVVDGTVGRPTPGTELRLVDEEGAEVAPGEVGAVQVRSPAAASGYWDDPVRTSEVFLADGWVRIGDLGRFDERGALVLVGRTTDVYIRGGYNVYPGEVEAALATHPAVGEVAVAGAPAPKLGELGVAVVVPRDGGAPPALADLRAWVAARLADYKAPDRLLLVEALPRTEMQKVDRRALARMAASAPA